MNKCTGLLDADIERNDGEDTFSSLVELTTEAPLVPVPEFTGTQELSQGGRKA